MKKGVYVIYTYNDALWVKCLGMYASILDAFPAAKNSLSAQFVVQAFCLEDTEGLCAQAIAKELNLTINRL